MTDDDMILGYSTPPPRPTFGPCAHWPRLTFLLTIWIPGLTTLLLMGRRSWLTGGLLLAAIPVAFAFFGPFWGEVLFRGTAKAEAGMIPFLVTTGVVILLNLAVTTVHYDYVKSASAVR